MNMKWMKAAAVRCLKTVCQCALSMITIEQAIYNIDWKSVLAVSATAGVYSIITSLAGLPEVPEDE